MSNGRDYFTREEQLSAAQAKDTITRFRGHDERTLARQYAVYHDETQLIQTSRQAAQELLGIFESDRDSETNQPGSAQSAEPGREEANS